MKKIMYIIVILIFINLSTANAIKIHEEISIKEREEIAKSTLKKSKNIVMIFTKGLICESCSIGIRKKLKKLDFIDSTMPKKGITLDVKTQLVKIYLKKEYKINDLDQKKLANAIIKAGYDPVTLYELKKNHFNSISLKKYKKFKKF